MTSIQGHECFCKKCISKSLLEFLPFLESRYNKRSVNLPAINPIVGFFGLSIAKYIEENLQKIFRSVLKARVPPFDRLCEKLLKAKSSNIYGGKFYMECYNFC